jgi:hypothetical protein
MTIGHRAIRLLIGLINNYLHATAYSSIHGSSALKWRKYHRGPVSNKLMPTSCSYSTVLGLRRKLDRLKSLDSEQDYLQIPSYFCAWQHLQRAVPFSRIDRFDWHLSQYNPGRHKEKKMFSIVSNPTLAV